MCTCTELDDQSTTQPVSMATTGALPLSAGSVASGSQFLGAVHSKLPPGVGVAGLSKVGVVSGSPW